MGEKGKGGRGEEHRKWNLEKKGGNGGKKKKEERAGDEDTTVK